MRRLGILGGTFDPIHEGHVALARKALLCGGLDGVVFLPMARPAHRTPEASAADRMAMCRLALAGDERFALSQAGMASGVKYTADTLGLLRREYPDARFTLIIGADKLPGLPYWYEADKLFSQCDFLCVPRSGVSAEEALEKAAEAGAKITLLPDFHTPYCAAAIRGRTERYEDAPGLNRDVLCYMAQRGLYQRDLTPRLQGMMNPKRFLHTLGVRWEAVHLAALHGLPVQRCALAGLLHDCAKGMSLLDMSRLAREEHLTEDEAVLSSGALLHAPVGAYLAKTEFGVRDEEVLSAIRSHTVGRPGMSKMEMCIFVADATEETREAYDGLEELRRLSRLSLPAAVYRSLELTHAYLLQCGRTFDSSSLKTMAYLKGMMTPSEKRLLALEEEGGT